MSEQPTAAEPSASIPKRIGRYQVKRVIGTGGMGTVYEAVQDHPRRAVALKVMLPGIASRSALRRFEYESQILARLRHPNIAQVYEAGTHDEGGGPVPYFALEYIPNARSITEYAKTKGLSARQRLKLFARVCDAIHHGHQKGIIHRDLKPGNILVDANGEPKIIDFGVARATDSDLAVTTLQTDVGQLIGTLQYMSPEQVEGDPHTIDGRSDVYSLGMVLFELLSDKLPYNVSGAAVLEAARIIREDPPTRISTVDMKLRGDLETIVLMALDKDRSRRYQSAHELLQDITRYLHDEPIVARRPTIWYILGSRSRTVVQRHPLGVSLAIIVLAAVFAEVVGVNLVHYWTPAFEQVKHFLAVAPWPQPAAAGLDAVCVIRITDDTGRHVERLSQAHGFTDVDWNHFSSLRRLHGRLMERLAGAGVGSVTWDLTFRAPTPFDEDFVRGAKALSEARVDVVVSVRDWPLGDGEDPEISGNISPEVQWGGTTANFTSDAPWNLHLSAQRGTRDPRPSLALASVAAFRRPGAHADFDVDEEHALALVRYYDYPDPGNPRQRRQLGEMDEIVLTAMDPYGAEPAEGRQPGDLIGIYVIEVPPDELLEAASVDYEWVFDADAGELRDRLGGKAVVIGDFRAGRDSYPHPDGRLIAGCNGHAVGLDMLLAGGVIRNEGPIVGWTSSAVAALLGVLIAVVSTGRVLRRVLLIAAVTVILFFVSLFAYRVLHYVFNPLVPLLAMIVAGEVAVGVYRARRTRLE
ncbi:MAG: serine/threonine protein kinase [Planctomycetota bacterium]